MASKSTKYQAGFSAVLNYTDTLFNTYADSAYGITSGKVKRVLDGYGSASFTLPKNNPNADTIAVGDAVEIYRATKGTTSDYKIFYGYVADVERDIYGNADVSAIEYMEFFSRTKFNINSSTITSKSLSSAMSTAFLASKWTIDDWEPRATVYGDFAQTLTLDYDKDDDVSNLQAVEDYLEKANAIGTDGKYHFWMDSGWLSYKRRYPIVRPEGLMYENPQTVELGKNITSITIEDAMPDVTIIKATGTDSSGNDVSFTGYDSRKNIVAREDTVSTFYLYDEVDFGSGFTAETLKAKAQEYIDSVGCVLRSYTVEAVDLYGTDDTIVPYAIGDMVTVVSAKHGINEKLPLSELTIDLCNPLKTTISVGASRPRITR